METLKKNKILVGVFVLVLLAFGYYFLTPSSKPAVPKAITLTGTVETGTTTPSASSAVGNSISGLFQRLSAASIDTTLFASPAWVSLTTISSPIPTDPTGKADLFAPIGQSNTFSSLPPPATSTASVKSSH